MTSLNRHGEDIPDPGGDAGTWGTILNSVLQFFDQHTWIVKSVSNDYTPNKFEFVLVDASAADVQITCPTAADDVAFAVKKVSDSGNDVNIVTPNAETIDGQTSWTLNGPYVGETIFSDGTDYYFQP